MTSFSSISVIAPARLHMGFLDLSGALGRHFGSIGVALSEPVTKLVITSAKEKIVTNKRAEKCLIAFCETFNVSTNVQIEVIEAIPEHVGLGSGTQMALAVGAGLNAFYDLGLSVRDIAATMDRGLRSGIGIGVFEQGGFVVDGGRGENTITPPMLAHFDIPETWRFILVLDQRGQGLHGQQETQAFKNLPPFPRCEAERLSYLLLMQALPAIAENNLGRFGEVITELQRTVGEHFSPAQGGVFTSIDVAAAMNFLTTNGAVAIGQTSWGPTGFCLIEGDETAEKLVEQAKIIFAETPLQFKVVSARNRGGEVVVNF
ncbi:MAG: beta-ribofuranosylaminobenzene 5'-phosphate synthase family protein [Methylococcaceae bacterium]